MRKLASVLLVTVMCLAMVACGKRTEHGELLEMIERGEYESAHYYIDNLKRQAAEEAEGDEEKESMVPVIYGEWTIVQNQEEDAIEKISFDEDGTCKIGDASFKWRVTDEYEENFSVKITEGESVKYQCSVSLYNGEYSLSLSTVNEEDNSTQSVGSYRNLSYYDVIEITTENWDEYFEITEEGRFGENAFGEVESFTYSQYISMKEEYLEKFSNSLSKLVMELDFTYGNKGCQVDLANQKYTLTDSYEINSYDFDSSIYQFSYSNYEDELYYRAQIMSAYYYKDNGYLSNFKTDMQVLRVEGTIYLLK